MACALLCVWSNGNVKWCLVVIAQKYLMPCQASIETVTGLRHGRLVWVCGRKKGNEKKLIVHAGVDGNGF